MRVAEGCWERARADAECCRLDGQEFEAYDRHLMVPELKMQKKKHEWKENDVGNEKKTPRELEQR